MRRLTVMGICLLILYYSVPDAQRVWPQLLARPEVAQQVDAAFERVSATTVAVIQQVQTLREKQLAVVVNGQTLPPIQWPAIVVEVASVQTTYPNGGAAQAVDPDDLSLTAGCSLPAQMFEEILKQLNSPAAAVEGIGAASIGYCKEYGIDNAYPLAMAIYEGSVTTAVGWAGWKPDGTTTANWGNIVCAGSSSCWNGFRDYKGDWKTALKDQFQLLAEYREGGGPLYGSGQKHSTITEAIHTWAPPSENDSDAYANFVATQVREWRALASGRIAGEGTESDQSQTTAIESGVDAYTAPALTLSGCLGVNATSAFNSSPGLRTVVLQPGEEWSFDASWKIDDQTLVYCGVYGGGVCNLAARYSMVFRQLGLSITSVPYHFEEAGIPGEDAVAIWSAGERGGVGGQDVIVRNTTQRTVYLTAQIAGGELIVKGWTA